MSVIGPGGAVSSIRKRRVEVSIELTSYSGLRCLRGADVVFLSGSRFNSIGRWNLVSQVEVHLRLSERDPLRKGV